MGTCVETLPPEKCPKMKFNIQQQDETLESHGKLLVECLEGICQGLHDV